MKEKRRFAAELAYLLGIVVLAIGTAFMEQADLGMSMVVAPAYVVYRWLEQTVPWFTFGMAEYCLQAVLLVLLSAVLRRFRVNYLFSFCTAVFYGFTLDGCMKLVGLLHCEGMAARLGFFGIGLVLGSVGVALLFHTYVAPEAYELVVKELAAAYGGDISKIKTCYDCLSCVLAVVLSFVFFGFGHFEGVKWGTVFCALVNGWLIGKISGGLEGKFVFYDAWRRGKA